MFKMQRVSVCFESHINRLMFYLRMTTTTAAAATVDSPNSIDSLFTLFRRYGFDDTHIGKLNYSNCQLFYHQNFADTIEPKLKFLIDQGLSTSDLSRLIAANPDILVVSLESSLSPALEYLRQLLVCNTLVISVMTKIPWGNCSIVCNNLRPNVDLLTTAYGIPIELIRRHLFYNPMSFLQNTEKLKDSVIRVENKLGIPPNSPMFLYGVRLFSTYEDYCIETKYEMLKSFGWTQSDVDTLMKKNPNCFLLSFASMEKKLEFLMNELRHYGFDHTQLVKFVSSYPQLLCSNLDEPKFMFLIDTGFCFSTSDSIRLISANPNLLLTASSLESSLPSALQILSQLLVCDTLVILVMKKLGCGNCSSVCNNLMPNVDLLSGYGIDIELIRKHLVYQPTSFMQNPEKFKEIVIRVEKNVGISPRSPMFLYGVKLVSTFSEECIESKCEMLKSLGWTQSDVDSFMMKNANCFSLSAASLKKKLYFLMNEVRLEPAYLTSNPYLLNYSLEKNIVPRHKVLLILKEKGLREYYPSYVEVVRLSESRFWERFVLPFKEVHQVYANYTGRTLEMYPTKSRQPFLKDNLC